MFGVYFVVALVIGHLATQLREREEVERRREARATALYRLARALAASPDQERRARGSRAADPRNVSGGERDLSARGEWP